MDSITHTLFGLCLYGAQKKEQMTKEKKRAFLFTSLVASQIPDIDIISQFWDTDGMYQMWHRGITHSVFLVPVWALLIHALCFLIWKEKDVRLFGLAMIGVAIHDGSDVLNAWGTGFLEPFSTKRLTVGVVPIVDFVVWGIMLAGYIVARKKRKTAHRVFAAVWIGIAIHFSLQAGQGLYLQNQVKSQYDKVTLAAEFVPYTYAIIGKKGSQIEISQASVIGGMHLMDTLHSKEDTDLTPLFKGNPAAKTLVSWSPFVVVFEDEKEMGVFDPRFYDGEASFLEESIAK